MLEPLEKRTLLSTNVSTFHNDSSSSGANTTEVQLTPSNVKTGSFGKLFATALDGQIYAQPLVQSGVTIGGAVHNVVFVATENDSLYAIDTGSGAVLWKRSFLTLANSGGILNNTLGASSISVVSSTDVYTQDISPSIGITSTPVIDPTTNLIYLVTKTKEVVSGTTYFVQRLHAIKLADGTDAAAPYLIGETTGSNTNATSIYVYGNGDGYVTDPYNNTGRAVVQFNALTENQRPALSLVNHTIYVSWASHGDNGPYHGWVVTWNVANITTSGFALSGVLNTSPNNGESGIWQSGGSLVFEADNSAFYFVTGNGNGGAPSLGTNGMPIGGNFNESLVKAQVDPTTTPTNQNTNGWGLKVVDFFIPSNVAALDGADSDFGSGAPILLPPQTVNGQQMNLIVVGGKDGRIFVLNRNNLGHYNATTDAALNDVTNASGAKTPPNADGGTLSAPAYFNGHLYVVSGYSGAAYEYAITSAGTLSTISQTSSNFGYEPGSPSISAAGTSNGIVWLEERNTNALHAYDANTLNTELWNSSQAAGSADALGAVVKFATPTIANGEVFIGTTNSLVAYGLTPAASSVPMAPVLASTALSGPAVNLTWTDPSSTPNLATAYLIEESTNGSNFTQVTTAPAGATSIGIGGLSTSTNYYFRIRGYNNIGYSNYSNVTSATTTSSQTSSISFSNGFASSAGSITLNGNAMISGNNLQLTDGNNNEAASSFSTVPIDITHFTSQFTFQISAGANTADGFTFTLQNVSPNAIGGNAGALGYQGMNNSAAIKFDLYSNSGEGPDSTGLYINGATPTSSGSVDLSSTGINLHSGDPIQASLSYDGITLSVGLLDKITGGTATENYAVNLPGVVGSSYGYAGFTGGTGGYGAVQSISNWAYTAGSTASPNAPTGLGVTPATATSVSLNWTNTALNQTGYHLDRATDAGFTQNLLTETLPAAPSSFTDTTTGLAPGGTYYYRLRAFNSVGDSGSSNVASVTIPVAPPKATNQMVTNVTTSEIDLSWQDNAGHLATGYHILRAANQGTFTTVATLPPTSRTAPSTYTYADTNLTPGTFYEYHIQAYNTSGYNDFAGTNATTLTVAVPVPAGLSGTIIGSSGSYDGVSTIAKAFDKNLGTFFDAATAGTTASPNYLGLDLGSTYTFSSVTYAPRVGFENRMVGGIFQASNDPTFVSGDVTLATITTAPVDGYTTVPVSVTGAFRYVRYLAPSGSYGNIAELQFAGTAASVTIPPSSTSLTGTGFGTAGSYDGTSTFAKALDGSLSTFFDAATANNDYVGLDLGAAATISSITYAPRVGFEFRMVGGIFQASNDSTFSTGVVTLVTITALPADGYSTVASGSSAAFRYVRYVAPANSYGNIAELQFSGSGGSTTPPTTTPPTTPSLLTGTGVGTSGSYDGVSTFSKALDGNLSTFFDGPTANGNYVGLDLGSTYAITAINFAPRVGYESRMVGGIFQGSNSADFSNPTNLYTVTAAPSDGFATVSSANFAISSGAFRYVRYLAPAGSYGNVTDVQFYGTATTAPSTPSSVKLSGTVIGTSGSYDGVSTTANVFDGNTATFFDAANPNNDWAGLDLGTTRTVTSITYTPRSGYASRMVGGMFQESTTADFSSNVTTLYTITSTPTGTTTVSIMSGSAFRYVRYLGPAGSYGNVAEIEFDGY